MKVRVEGVAYAYGRKMVLDGVDWEIGPGITGLLGPNGAGKTTLLNLLVGLAKPSRGKIETPQTGGRPRVGYLPQRFSLAGEMKVLDTVTYAAWINGRPRRECVSAAQHALALVGLTSMETQRCRSVSGGQRQRLGIATALAHEPDLLVLDEPTVGLDPSQRLNVREVIAEIGRDRMVLLSTHLLEDVTYLCQRVGVLADKRLVFDGEKDELERLIGGSEASGSLGSGFERSYDALIQRLARAE